MILVNKMHRKYQRQINKDLKYLKSHNPKAYNKAEIDLKRFADKIHRKIKIHKKIAYMNSPYY
jgi:hypothetical protein